MWTPLTEESQLETIKALSFKKPQVIFKHSTRCSISQVVKSRLEKSPATDQVNYFYLDLIQHRNISNKIAEDFSVYHESPQILLIKNGECVYDESHTGISQDYILENI